MLSFPYLFRSSDVSVSRSRGEAKPENQVEMSLWRSVGSSYLGREISRTVVAESSDSDDDSSQHSDDQVLYVRSELDIHREMFWTIKGSVGGFESRGFRWWLAA